MVRAMLETLEEAPSRDDGPKFRKGQLVSYCNHPKTVRSVKLIHIGNPEIPEYEYTFTDGTSGHERFIEETPNASS